MVSHHKHKRDLSTPAPKGSTVALICAVLAIVTIAAYWPVLGADFVNYDDDDYVTENRLVLKGLTLDGAKWAFSMDDGTGNWHPLTWLSHMLDCELYDQNAGLHHLTNLIIHTTSTVVLLWVLVSMTGKVWPSAFVAAAFALHPLHVESVAWIAERKDVLSGLFWFLTMVCYLRYTRTGGRGSYILALVVFGLGLMAKPMLVTLPFVLLLLDYWPLKRLESKPAVSPFRTMRSLAIEKIPFFILSAASCVVTYIAQQAGGAVRGIEFVSFGARLSNAMVAYVAYIVRMVWPVGLAVLYPLKSVPFWQPVLAFLVLSVITVAALLWIRRRKYVAVGWLWYIGTLVPVIGLVQVGVQSHADRYTYIPLTGLFMITAWAVGDLCRRRPTCRFVSGVVAVLLLAGMFAGTRHQLGYWKDSRSLCRRAIEVTENNFTMHSNLGVALAKEGQPNEAISHYRRAVQINPDYAEAHNNLGVALSERGQLDEAISHYRRALQIDPDHVKAHYNLGIALSQTGQVDEAIGHYRRAVQINPDFAAAHNNMGIALAKKGQLDEAISHYRRALQIDSDYAEAHNNLVVALVNGGQLDEAISHYRRAVQINPGYAPAYNNLGSALVKSGQWDEAISHYRRAVQIDPDDAEAHYNLGIALSQTGQVDEAIGHYRRAVQIDPDHVKAHNNLGNALAKTGQLDEAISHFRRAVKINPNLAQTHNNLGVALVNGGQLDEAISHYRRAVQIDPDDAEAHANLGIALSQTGQLDEAVTHYRRAVELQPEYLPGLNNLAWILATAADPMVRNPAEAVSFAEKACQLTDHKNTAFLDTLAVAYASAGRFDDAVSTVEKALKQAEAADDETLAQEIRGHLKLFKEGQSYIEKPVVEDGTPEK